MAGGERKTVQPWQAGMRPGDVIVSADMKPVASLNDLDKISKNDHHNELLVNILRGNGALFLVIKK